MQAQHAALGARLREMESRRVKREFSPIQLDTASGDVVDLTLDDSD